MNVPSNTSGGALALPVTLDGSANAAIDVLTIKTGKSQSGLVLRAGGAATSPGVLFQDSSGVLKGAVGYGITAGDFIAGSAANNLVIQSSTTVYIRGQSSGVKLVSNSGNFLIKCDDSIGAQMSFSAAAITVDGTGPNITCNALPLVVTGGTYAPTSGTKNCLNVTSTFAPTSGTAAWREVDVTYTVNQTGGANGTVHGIRVAATETAVVGSHNLIELLGGASGTTTLFKVDNTGLASFGLAKIANGGGSAPTLGTIGGSGPTTAAQSGWIKEVRAGTTVFIPCWV